MGKCKAFVRTLANWGFLIIEVYIFRYLGLISTSIYMCRYNYDIYIYTWLLSVFSLPVFSVRIQKLFSISCESQNMKNTNAFHRYFGTGPFKHIFFCRDIHKLWLRRCTHKCNRGKGEKITCLFSFTW